MKTCWRVFIIGLGSLFIGICVNQFLNQGIQWRLLLYTFFPSSEKIRWAPISIDSAFMLLRQEQTVFVDVRSSEDFAIDHIPGAISCPFLMYYSVSTFFARFDRNIRFVIYAFALGSEEAHRFASFLTREGFKDVMVLEGGFSEWLEKGFPVERESRL
jgi:rhodanese-related sulfurtransferase